MGKKDFKKEVMAKISLSNIDFNDAEEITDIVVSYYQNGFKDGQEAMIKAFNEITKTKPVMPNMSNSLLNDKGED